MIITNIETVPGKTIVKHLGMVSGNTVRSKHAGRDHGRSEEHLRRRVEGLHRTAHRIT